MLLENLEMNALLRRADDKTSRMGMKLSEKGKVTVAEFKKFADNKYTVISLVETDNRYITKFKKDIKNIEYSCNCTKYENDKQVCEHIVAVIFDMFANENKYLTCTGTFMEQKSAISLQSAKGKNLVMDFISYYERLELQKLSNLAKRESVRIIPKVTFINRESPELMVSFRIGSTKEYVLKDLYRFVEALKTGESIKYGKELEFAHIREAFTEDSLKFVDFIDSKMSEYNKYIEYEQAQKMGKGRIYAIYSALDEYFELVKGKDIEYDVSVKKEGEETKYVKFIDEDPKLEFIIEANKDELEIHHEISKYKILSGKNFTYILAGRSLYRCSKKFESSVLPAINSFKVAGKNKIRITKDRISSFCGYVLPILEENATVKYDKTILENYFPEKLGTKVFLDLAKNNDIVAEIKFCYGEEEFNPYSDTTKVECNRNNIEELKVRNIFKKHHFIENYEKEFIYLKDEEDIYEFIQTGIEEFMEKFEVLVTDRLKNRQIISSKRMSMGVKVDNNLLSISLDDIGLTENEIKNIFKAYKLKKKYFRLKDGSFLNFELAGISTLVDLTDTLGLTEKDLVDGEFKVDKYRALSIESFFNDNDNIELRRDESFTNVVKNITDVRTKEYEEPKNINCVLRNYQKTGFNWLKTLDECGFGGILADDMGLGKTVQVITLLQEEKNTSGRTSIVVCPSSLYINWQKEINKFAPELKIQIVTGNAQTRANLIKKCQEYDVNITSYDLLKRDIEEYKNIKFKYSVADEAQYIKNDNTQNAKALKQINSEIRFALTGTPMENSLAELWSIFDYVMPGYLYTYRKFKEMYEVPIVKDEDSYYKKRLQKIVAPFILRRLKKDVLSELPEKTETVMYNEMNEAQADLYKAHLASAKVEIKEELDKSNNKIKILSLITRLRQICCHPALFVENYKHDSEKLNQCMEIIEEGVNGGHKILLFSQFTSMFEIISEELRKKDIKFLTLTGATKIDKRVEMVEEFNKSNELSVFLISLKAGGTGLNLTGADMVIHYDPWWNVSAQNQATDRAYRFGQKNNVQVFKLITQNSIEEKIQKLQERKNELSGTIIKEGEMFINTLSKNEILDLFDL